MMTGIQAGNWLQQVSGTMRQALDGNQDGRIENADVEAFLNELLAAVRDQSGTAWDSGTGAAIASAATATPPVRSLNTPPDTAPTPPTVTAPTTGGASGGTPVATGGWRDFVFGKAASSNYAGVMVAPSREIGAGYQAGAFRSQLEGFNHDKFDPGHPEGMTLKMIAARVFEQFDVYSDTSIDDVVQAFNELGIPATKIGFDKIDFGNGEGPVDVIRNAAWLDGDTSAGMAWQWAPEVETEPMNFLTLGGKVPVTESIAGTPGESASDGVDGVDGAGTTSPLNPATAGSRLYPGASDQIDLSSVNWLHANVSRWPVTSKITDVEIGSDTISVEHTKAGHWPAIDYNGIQVEGNPWVFVNRGGQWYGATYEWLRPGQTEKGVTAEGIGGNIKVPPLADWTPAAGELVGFMVSTPARADGRTVNERTNIVMTRWPS